MQRYVLRCLSTSTCACIIDASDLQCDPLQSCLPDAKECFQHDLATGSDGGDGRCRGQRVRPQNIRRFGQAGFTIKRYKISLCARLCATACVAGVVAIITLQPSYSRCCLLPSRMYFAAAGLSAKQLAHSRQVCAVATPAALAHRHHFRQQEFA